MTDRPAIKPLEWREDHETWFDNESNDRKPSASFWTARPLNLIVDGKKQWTYFFLSHNQAGGLTGEGYAVRYGSSYPTAEPRVMAFAICNHEAVAGANANPRRGWHPARCKHCGLDMTVDSGD